MQKTGKVLITLGILAVLLGGVFAVNAIQASDAADQEYAWSHPILVVPNTNQSGAAAIVNYLSLTVILGTHDLFANQTLLHEGWTANCQVLCVAGIKYSEDPTVHVVNGGIDCIGFKVHGTASGTTCAFKLNATYTMVSASSGHAPLFTDNACPATVAITDGVSITAGTYAAGVPSAGSATDTLSHTWTGATGATVALDLACVSWTNSNAANTLYAEGQIGTTTVNVSDTLETIWSFTYASS